MHLNFNAFQFQDSVVSTTVLKNETDTTACLFTKAGTSLSSQRISKTRNVTLFFSGHFKKLDQNCELFKVPVEQWCFSVCYYLENKPSKNSLTL